MADANWLRTYYGKDFEILNPQVILEGSRYAVVRLSNIQSPTSAYVLIKKNGRHNASLQKSLHEGGISPAVMVMLQAALTKVEQP